MDTCAYLLERYPEPFVHAICTGAYCVVGGNWDVFPLLDMAGNRLSTAQVIYAVACTYENLYADIGTIGSSLLAPPTEVAKRMADVEVKEVGRKAEERQARHERHSDQPWRKGHR
jgi:hypothetical protein